GPPGTPATSRLPPSARGARRRGTRTGPGGHGCPGTTPPGAPSPASPPPGLSRIRIQGDRRSKALGPPGRSSPSASALASKRLGPVPSPPPARSARCSCRRSNGPAAPPPEARRGETARGIRRSPRSGPGEASVRQAVTDVAHLRSRFHRLLLGRSGGRHQGDLEGLVHVLHQLHRQRPKYVCRNVGQVLLVL